jgi:hypothetical protein
MGHKKIVLVFGFLFFPYVYLGAAEVKETKPSPVVNAAKESDQQI